MLHSQMRIGFVYLMLGAGAVFGDPGETPYRVVEVEEGGKIAGAVRFAGDYPPLKYVRVRKDDVVCGTSKLLENYVVNPEDGGLANVVVTVEGIAAGKAFAEARQPMIIQQECMYAPHVQVYRPDDTLVVVNTDKVFHNIHTFAGETTLFNVAHPAKAGNIRRRLDTADVVGVKCDIHDWMSAYLVPVAHPYFAITDKAGRFEIDRVPPGTYTVRAWHEVIGVLEKSATVAAATTTDVSFAIAAGE